MTNSAYLSDCHDAPLKVVGGDEGTNHYECSVCHKACNFHQSSTSKPETSSTEKTLREILRPALNNAYQYGNPDDDFDADAVNAALNLIVDQAQAQIIELIEVAKLEAQYDLLTRQRGVMGKYKGDGVFDKKYFELTIKECEDIRSRLEGLK